MPDSATPWTTAYQAPPSMGFSRWEYWSGVPLPSPSTRRLGLKWRNREDIKNVYSSAHLGTWGIILALTRRNLWRGEFIFSWLGFVLIHFSHVRLWVMPQTVACQAPLSMGFFRILQEYWSGLPFPSSVDLSDPRMEAASLSSPMLINIKLVMVYRSPDDWIWWYIETGALIIFACDHSLVPNISSSS